MNQTVGVMVLVGVNVVCIRRTEINMGMIVMAFGKMMVQHRAKGWGQ